MNGTAVRPDKSKLYYSKLTPTWWLKKPAYLLFMLRELSSVFIAIFLEIGRASCRERVCQYV